MDVTSPRVVDGHNDLLLEVAFRSHRRGEANPLAEHWLPKLRRGGVASHQFPRRQFACARNNSVTSRRQPNSFFNPSINWTVS